MGPNSLVNNRTVRGYQSRGQGTASPVFIPAQPRLDGAGRSGRTVFAGESSQSSVWGSLAWPWPAPLRLTAALSCGWVQRGSGLHAVDTLCSGRATGGKVRQADGQRWLLGDGPRGVGETRERGNVPFITTCPLSLPLPHARPSINLRAVLAEPRAYRN